LESFGEDLPIRHSLVKSPFLHLIFSSSSKLEESSLEMLKSLKGALSGHDLLELLLLLLLLLLLVSESVLLLIVALVAGVVLVGVVVHVGESNFFLLGQSAMK
jgi:hypothetical protein